MVAATPLASRPGLWRCVRRVVAAAMTAGAGLAAAQGSGADAPAGRLKAGACAVCHGPAGLSSAPDAPNLAGQPAAYLAAQLKAYRSGARRHEVMGVMAKPLSDDDIAQLSAWFASIRVEATAPN